MLCRLSSRSCLETRRNGATNAQPRELYAETRLRSDVRAWRACCASELRDPATEHGEKALESLRFASGKRWDAMHANARGAFRDTSATVVE